MINFAAALVILILSGYLASKRLAKLEKSATTKEPLEAQEAEQKSNEIKKEPSKKRAPKKVKVKVKKKKKKK
jgi:hypothetical protein